MVSKWIASNAGSRDSAPYIPPAEQASPSLTIHQRHRCYTIWSRVHL